MKGPTTPSIALAVYAGLLLAVLALYLMPAWFFGHHSLREIGAPCREHGGVSQYVPEQGGLAGYEPATVVCRDGKVGRV